MQGWELSNKGGQIAASLEADRSHAWEIAHYEREQTDKLTSQIRFSLTAANAASMVTVLNIGHSLTQSAQNVAWSALAFLVGTVFSGVALLAQQNAQVSKSGSASVRAATLDRAVSIARTRDGLKADILQLAIDEAHAANLRTLKVPYWSIWLQNFGMASWLAGALIIATPAVRTLL